MKIDPRNPRHWLLLFQQAAYTLLAIVARFFRSKPTKPIVLLYGHQLSGNLKALYVDWNKRHQANMDFYFLSLDPIYSASLEREGISVLRCNRPRDMLILSQASAMITDHGLHLMTPLIRFTDIIFIDVWHGIPFKGFVPEDFRLQHRYDETWVSSPLLKKLYEERFGFQAEKVINAGYARTDQLFNCDGAETTVKTTYNIPVENRVVLYAPTWQQDDSGRELFPFGQSEEQFIGRLNEICGRRGATLVIRSHMNASIAKRSYESVAYCSQKEFPDTETLLKGSDIVICDWSSIAFDYLALRRPTVFLDVAPPFKNGFSLDQSYRFGKVISDMTSLCEYLGVCLDTPEKYQLECGDNQERVLNAVYGNNTHGNCASLQIDRLAERINVT